MAVKRVKYSLSVLKCTLTTLSFFVLHCSSQQIPSLRIRNERTKPGYVRSLSCDLVEYLAKNCKAKSTFVFCERFGNLGYFNIDCKAEELTQGLKLVISIMDSSLEKDFQTSSVVRVYYEPLTSSTSEKNSSGALWQGSSTEN